MKPGTLGVLNVGAGDTKLSFDPNNPAERIRAARIVKDMLRRGYALLIEVDDGKGGKRTTRALDFDENTCEYIIADFDPQQAAEADAAEPKLKRGNREQDSTEKVAEAEGPGTPSTEPKKRGRPTKKVPAGSTSGVAVARTAGG